MRRTKIVATLGPSSSSVEVLSQMIEAGMDVARLNMSHGTHEEHQSRVLALREAAQGRPVAIMLDTKGPEVRLGRFRGGLARLEGDAVFQIRVSPAYKDCEGDSTWVYADYPGLPKDVTPGDVLLIDDGNIAMVVLEVDEDCVTCRVKSPGTVTNKKKLSVKGKSFSLPPVSDADARDIAFGVRLGVDFVAASFIRTPEDVIAVRRVIEGQGAVIPVIAKIETRESVESIEQILKVCDGLMIARGDLGVEFPPEEVPIIQKRLIRMCNRVGKPVVTATQMLESMVNRPTPTRAEASDVANAILDGTDAVMLSAETATGKYPVECVRTMASIAVRTEREMALQHREIPAFWGESVTVTDAVSRATWTAARELRAAAIITATESGYTARMIARLRPSMPVIAATPNEGTLRQLLLTWGVYPVLVPGAPDTDTMIDQSIQAGLKSGIVANGDLVILTAGVPTGIPGTTNLMKVHVLGNVMVKGTGIGGKTVTGRARIITSEASDPAGEGDIAVLRSVESPLVPSIAKASGLVVEEGGLSSNGAVLAVTLEIPAVVGASGATRLIADGSQITIDSTRGLVYSGRANIPS
ncbi:MAG: pyruvate kinase [Bacillota bacterium]